ncbi:MAG: AAA family ATPase [Burkholderiales bacterium]|nr:AAA family ATPase [Burkholderiales bacterium]MDE2398702.1 AAA family ATPase [Burkholderiales bacterium]MDE2455815.1 AAA family ATPase [Burkholderiales bacterium]
MSLSLLPKPEPALPAYVEVGAERAVFEMAYRSRMAVLVKGPTGCGKTRFIEHMAARLGRPLFTVSCHDDLSAADLVGRHLIRADGTYWVDGPLTRAVREGGICYLDEVVEARKDTTVVLHSLSDTRRMLAIERNGETLEAPPEFMLVVSYNPGYQHLLKGLKPSTRQRFVSLRFDFSPQAVEEQIVALESGLSGPIVRRLVTFAQALRNTAEHDLDEVPGTRLVVDAAKLIAQGCDPLLACRTAVAECLSDDPEVVQALMQVAHAVLGE